MQPVLWFLYTYWSAIVYPVIAVLAGLAVGLLLEKFLVNYLAKLALKTKTKFDDILVAASRKIFKLGFLLLGMNIALKFIDIAAPYDDYASKFLKVSFTLLAVWYTARVLSAVSELYFARIYGGQSSSLVRIIIRSFVFGLGGLLILQNLGISITPILTALGVGGLAVALALQETLTNFFAGIQILATQTFRPGDFVELTGEDDLQNGYITDISWRNITLRTVHNNLIIIPNSKFSQSIVKNYNFPRGDFTSPVTVGVHYESDLKKVEEVSLEVAHEVEQQYGDPHDDTRPYMWFHSFNASSIDFNIMLRANDFRKHFKVKHEFIKKLQTRFAAEGIEIPYPIRNLYFRNNLSVDQAAEK